MSKKEAIRIQKIYEGIHRHPKFIKANPKGIQELITQTRENPEYFKDQIKGEDTLGPGKFTFSIREGKFGFADKDLKIPVVAEITVVHWLDPKPSARSILSYILWIMLIGTFISFIIGYFIVIKVGEMTKDMREDKCCIYSINGRPTAIKYAGEMIKLDDNGKVRQLDELTWNPYYRDVLEKPCSVCEEKFIGESYCKRVEVWGAEGITTISQPLYQKHRFENIDWDEKNEPKGYFETE